MSDPRHALGLAVEAAVADWLTRTGWTIIARRARSAGGGEVDIIAVDAARILVAVEVRARRHQRAGSAGESVHRRRIGRMRRTLAALAASAPPHAGLRIDLVTAEPADGDRAWVLRRTANIDAG
jgi:Holliday junction resolvase-like predicted endonuclease